MRFFNLRQFRIERNLTQKEFAQKVNISQSNASYIENATQEITDTLLSQIKSAFDMPDIDMYIYERDTFGCPRPTEKLRIRHSKSVYDADWNNLKPIRFVERFPIFYQQDNIKLSDDGTIIILASEQSHSECELLIIGPSQLSRQTILMNLAKHSWFTESMLENFKRMYFLACALARVPTARQLKPT